MIKQRETYILPSNLEDEISQLQESINRFKSGEMSLMEFKIQRVPFGCYEQRKHDTYMVRIRCGGAIVTPEQLEKIAEISKVHAAHYIHLTTRQEIQLHYVLPQQSPCRSQNIYNQLFCVAFSTEGQSLQASACFLVEGNG